MKKVLALPILLGAILMFTNTSEAKTSVENTLGNTVSAASAPQIYRGQYRNRNNRVVRVYTQTRIERRGRSVFRVTYQITQRPNGRTVSRVISRVRIR